MADIHTQSNTKHNATDLDANVEAIRKKYPKIAIVHDWLYGGGAERVVYELHQLFPDAPIYTSYCSDEWRRKLDNKVVTGYLQHWPFNRLRKLLPVLRIQWFSRLDLSGFDLVISSSGNGEAKGVQVPSSTAHLCYCHSPTHFYWRHYDQYLAEPGFSIFNPIVRLALRLLVGPLRRWDYRAAQRPTAVLANSTHIRNDIKTYYDRESTVVFPPVDTERFARPDKQPAARVPTNDGERHGFVTVGRQVPYKHFDIIVQACTQLGLPLTVVGSGPEHARLMQLAGPTVSFITGADASDQAVNRAMRTANAFISASYEDFGITPIEALASGTPLIAYRAGGALDYVNPGVTGEFFDRQTVESLVITLTAFDPAAYDERTVRQSAKRFSRQSFQNTICQSILTLS